MTALAAQGGIHRSHQSKALKIDLLLLEPVEPFRLEKCLPRVHRLVLDLAVETRRALSHTQFHQVVVASMRRPDHPGTCCHPFTVPGKKGVGSRGAFFLGYGHIRV